MEFALLSTEFTQIESFTIDTFDGKTYVEFTARARRKTFYKDYIKSVQTEAIFDVFPFSPNEGEDEYDFQDRMLENNTFCALLLRHATKHLDNASAYDFGRSIIQSFGDYDDRVTVLMTACKLAEAANVLNLEFDPFTKCEGYSQSRREELARSIDYDLSH